MSGYSLALGDKLLIAGLLALAALLFWMLPHLIGSDGESVEVTAGRALVGKYPLTEDVRLEVAGKLGKTEIEIVKGRVRILSSPCRNKICVHMGSIGREGGIVVCVPNEVAAIVGKSRNADLDAVSP